MEEIDVPNPTCRAQNCSLESLFLDDAEQHQPPACATACGRGQRFAVCCGPLLPRCGQGCCRQSLPPPTTAGPAAPPAAAGPHGFGPAFLDSGVSVVQRLANVFAHRKNPKRCCGTGRGGGAIGVGVQAGEARSARPFSLTTLNNISPPGGSTPGGEVNVSLFAVGDCCGCPTKGAADCRQSLPPATATGAAAPHATSAPGRCGPAL